MELKEKKTRFRAYQLGSSGSSFSYFDGSSFTLIEARLNDTNIPSLSNELKICGKETIDCLHITSWDVDHCSKNDLELILKYLQPPRIEYPGYNPHSDSGKECLAIIKKHENSHSITSVYVSGLDTAQPWGTNNILYNNRKNHEEANNNSTIKLFRTGCFTVLSLGDVEKEEIAEYLLANHMIQNEVDVMILAHHGADNGFTSSKFIKGVAPKVAICTSNYDNQYDHPKQEIRDLLYRNEVSLYTTKTGDVIIESIGNNTIDYRAINLRANSTEVSSAKEFKSKKYFKWLASTSC